MTSGRARVLHIIQNLNYGGMERLLADIVRTVDPDRFDSHVLVLQYVGRYGNDLEGIAAIHQGKPMGRLSMLHPRALADQIRAIAPDVVHSHSGVWHKASLAARLAGVPRVIHTEHGRQSPDPWQARLVDGIASGRTDVAVAVSDAIAELLRNSVVRARCAVRVIVNGVDTNLHRPRPDDGRIRAELGIHATAPIIGSVGRLEHIKGYDYMVAAFAHLLRTWNSAVQPVLVIAGDGAQRESLEASALQAGIASSVRFLGWRDDVQSLVRSFSLFTMASRSEGTSVSLLEAMSAGLCPIVTDVGGNAAVLGEPLRQRLVVPHDPQALAAGWEVALADPDRLRMDGATARNRVEVSYSLRQMVDGYEKLYVDGQ